MNDSNLDLFARNQQYRDDDLTFLVHTYHDFDLLALMLRELRAIYPDARLIICSDGDDDPRLPDLSGEVEGEFHLGENLYEYDRAGSVCHRMLDLFLERPTRYLLKVDPDTGFHRRLRFLPAHSGMFGTVQSHELFCSIQGGCFGVTLDWAARLHQTSAMLDPVLRDASRTWAVHKPMHKYCQEIGRVSSDWLFGYVATALGIPQFGFSEIRCRWRKPVDNTHLKYAITHPVSRPLPSSLQVHEPVD